MEVKKSPKADLNNLRTVFLMTGMIIALGVVIAVFHYSKEEVKVATTYFSSERFDPETVIVTHSEPERAAVRPITVMPLTLIIRENNARIETPAHDMFPIEDEPVVFVTRRAVQPPVVDDPIVIAEFMPKFMGGDINAFRKWVMERISYPKMAEEVGIGGKVILSFVIEKDGSLSNIKVLQTPDRSLSEEAERVLQTSPKWTPGKQRNTPVRVCYTLPVEFRIQN